LACNSDKTIWIQVGFLSVENTDNVCEAGGWPSTRDL